MPLYIHTEIGMLPNRLLVCLIVLTITGAFVTSDAQAQNTSQRIPNSPTQASDPRADTRKAEAEARRYHKLGVKYGRANLLKQAVDLFNRAVLLKPNYKEAYYDLGDTYLVLKRWKEAIDAFEQVTKIDPQDLEAYSKLAEARAGLWMRAKA